jgi:hypothetical protein
MTKVSSDTEDTLRKGKLPRSEKVQDAKPAKKNDKYVQAHGNSRKRKFKDGD